MYLRDKILGYFRQHDRGWILSLFVVVCLIYFPFLGTPFFFDDLSFFTAQTVGSFADAPIRFDPRWLPYASLGRTWAWVGDIPHLYHLGNALLHAANVILLFYLLRQLVTAVLPNSETASVTWGAWFGALLFACNPVAVYAVGYIVQRSILMATLFALVMQIAYLRGLLTGQKRWLVLSVLAYALAGLSKEHSVMLPAVLMSITILLRDKIQLSTRVLGMTWIMLFMVSLLLILRSNGVVGRPYEIMSSAMFAQQNIAASTHMLHLLSAMTQAGLFFKYLLLWLLPNPAWMSIDMREQFISTLAQWQGWLGAIGFMAYGVIGVRLLLRPGRLGLFGLALLYPWLQYLVEFTTIRIQEPFVLYRSYLWMPGMALLIALLLIKLPGRRIIIVLSCFVILLVPLSWNRLWVFADNYRLWNDAAVIMPNEQVAGADRILYNRGNAAMAAHKWEEAVEDLQRVAKLSPQLAPVHNALANAYFNSERYQEAITQYDVAISLRRDDAQAYFGKGMSLKRLHEDESAMVQMIKACELKNMMACVLVSRVPDKYN